MPIFENYKSVERKKVAKSKTLTFEESFKQSLDVQLRLANGEIVKNSKGNPVRSWFMNGRVRPQVGITSLLKTDLEVSKGSEVNFLKELQEDWERGLLGEVIADWKKRDDAAKQKRKQTIANKG